MHHRFHYLGRMKKLLLALDTALLSTMPLPAVASSSLYVSASEEDRKPRCKNAFSSARRVRRHGGRP